MRNLSKAEYADERKADRAGTSDEHMRGQGFPSDYWQFVGKDGQVGLAPITVDSKGETQR